MNEVKNKRELTCIICPRGCQLTVDIGEKIEISGNICPRGEVYAINECTNPMRTVTSTVRTSDGRVVAVKTSTSIPKSKMMECMQAINIIIAQAPVKVGDVLADDVFGAKIVATQNLN